MPMVHLCDLDDRFQADVWTQALTDQGITHLLRTYQDTAYDGLFVSQRGFGSIYVDEMWLEKAQAVHRDLLKSTRCHMSQAADLAQALDHSLLDPDAHRGDLERFLRQCREYQVAAACVLPWMIPEAVRELAGDPVKVCGVVGFPTGAHSATVKLTEAREQVSQGAEELDVVFNRGLLRSGRLDEAQEELARIVHAVAPVPVKVIVECGRLGTELAIQAAQAAVRAGAAWVKTGTGWLGPATVEDVRHLRHLLPSEVGVKAAGGIKDLNQALAMLDAGADRLGTSSGHLIMAQARERWPRA